MELNKTTVMYAPVIEIKGRQHIDYSCICFLKKDAKEKFEKSTGISLKSKKQGWKVIKISFTTNAATA